MRIVFEVVAILEGARFALVYVDRQQARRRFAAHDAPFAPGREAGAAEAAQAGLFEFGDDFVAAAFAACDGLQQRVAVVVPVAGVVGVAGESGVRRTGRNRPGDRLRRRAFQRVRADDGDRRRVAAPDARDALDSDVVAGLSFKFGDEVLAAEQLAGHRIADAHGQRRRRALAFLDDVEVVVERRHLIDFRRRQFHLAGEGDDVGGADMAVFVLHQVQELDQQVAPPRTRAEQRANFGERVLINASAARLAALLAAAAAPCLYCP